MNFVTHILQWFSGGPQGYMTLIHCMNHDYLWIAITVLMDVAVATGYVLIALHWSRNARLLPGSPAKRALGAIRNIFIFCGCCGYLFIPIKMVWPAWRLYDMVMAILVYYTWKYAVGARDLKVVYTELGRTSQLAEELERSKAESRRKSFFLNAISHDLRTPLNGLLLQANLAGISADRGDVETLNSALAEIKASTADTAAMLDQLLECARLGMLDEANSPTTFALRELIEKVCGGMAPQVAAKDLNLLIRCPSDLHVTTDRIKLDRVITNLVSNAVKFTHAGSVSVEVEHSSSGVEIHIRDTGCGVAAEHKDRLFDEFYQVHNNERDRKKGFGLGLAIARRLARQLGGDVAVESAVGTGSRFTLALPGVVADVEAQPRLDQTQPVLAS